MYTNHDRPSCKRDISAYTRNDVAAILVENLCKYNCSETLWITIRLKHQDSILVGGIYRSTSRDNSGNIRTLLERANQLKYSHIIVTGDFNMSTTNWELIQATNPMEEDLLDTIHGLYWTQHIDQPTKTTAYKQWNCQINIPANCCHLIPSNRFLGGFPVPSQFAAARLTHYSTMPHRPSRPRQRFLLSGDVHQNPGHATKYPCSVQTSQVVG